MYEKLVERLDELIIKGDQVQQTKFTSQTSSFTSDVFVDKGAFHEWKAGSLSFLRRVFGQTHTHSELFEKECKASRAADVFKGIGILKAAKQDIEAGFLKTLESLVSADIFSDFLEMAEHLLEQGYKDPAASLAGAVLEDGLRRIATKNAVTIKTADDISALNQKLAQAQVYNRLTQKQVAFWNDLRNKADHAEFDNYNALQVGEMLRGIGSFLEEHV